MNPSEKWLEKYGFWPNVTDEPKGWYQLTTREMYNLHMDTYTQDTAALSFTKYKHPSYEFIKNQLGMRAVPYLLEDIQAQHPDGSFDHNSYHSFWGRVVCSVRFLTRTASPVLRFLNQIVAGWSPSAGYTWSGELRKSS